MDYDERILLSFLELMEFAKHEENIPEEFSTEANIEIQKIEPSEENGRKQLSAITKKPSYSKSLPNLHNPKNSRAQTAGAVSTISNGKKRVSMTGLRRTSYIGMKKEEAIEIETEPLVFPEYTPTEERKTIEEWSIFNFIIGKSTSQLLQDYKNIHNSELLKKRIQRKKLYQLKSQRSRRSISQRKSIFNKIRKEKEELRIEKDESKTLQTILESVWDMMETPNQDRIDFVYKYSLPENALNFREVVQLWYKTAQAIVMREKLLEIRRRISENRLLLDYQILEECDCEYLQSINCYDEGIDDDDTHIVFRSIQVYFF